VETPSGTQPATEPAAIAARSAPARLTPQGFAELFRASARVLWCIAVGVMNDRSRADDVLQEAAIVALGKLEQFDASTSFQAWAGQIVRYVALNEGRKAQRERGFKKELAETAIPLEAAPSTPAHRGAGLPGGESFDDEVNTALGELDDIARSCLLMKTTLDMAYADIARILAIPEGTAMSHVHRARKAMRARLIERGYDGASEKGGRP